MHSGPFGSLVKLGAKWAELVQKFVPRGRVGIFHNERTRSAPLDPKLTFRCVLYYLGVFLTVWMPYETRCKTGRTSAKVRVVMSRRNFLQRMHPIHPIRPYTDVLVRFVHLVASGPFGCLTKLGAKRAELVQKFVPRSRCRIIHNERTRSTPLDPKLTFWCV